MATKTILRYDHPNATVRRQHMATVGGATASDTLATFHSYMACKVNAIHGIVQVAGTAATNLGIIQNGTTSIGVIVMSTEALATRSSVLLGTSLAAGAQLSVKQGADVTGRFAVCFEYEVLQGAVVTNN